MTICKTVVAVVASSEGMFFTKHEGSTTLTCASFTCHGLMVSSSLTTNCDEMSRVKWATITTYSSFYIRKQLVEGVQVFLAVKNSFAREQVRVFILQGIDQVPT
jgi:hypothetical protein